MARFGNANEHAIGDGASGLHYANAVHQMLERDRDRQN